MFAQALSIIGLICHTISFQQKSKLGLLMWQMFGCLFFSVHFFMIGGLTGCFLNGICIFRSLAFFKEDIKKIYKYIFVFLFIILYAVSFYITLSNMPHQLTKLSIFLEFLPICTVSAVTVSYLAKKMFVIRTICLLNSLSWMIYNVFYFSIGGILCECIVLVSIITGIIRFDLKKSKKGGQENE